MEEFLKVYFSCISSRPGRCLYCQFNWDSSHLRPGNLSGQNGQNCEHVCFSQWSWCISGNSFVWIYWWRNWLLRICSWNWEWSFSTETYTGTLFGPRRNHLQRLRKPVKTMRTGNDRSVGPQAFNSVDSWLWFCFFPLGWISFFSLFFSFMI